MVQMTSTSESNSDKKASKPASLVQGTLSAWIQRGNSSSSSSNTRTSPGDGPSSSKDGPEPPSLSASSRDAPGASSSSPSSRSQTDSNKPLGISLLSSDRSQSRRSAPSTKLSREDLRDIAETTLTVLDDGFYIPPGYDEPYDLLERMYCTNGETTYYPPDDEEIAGWQGAQFPTQQTRILVKECSTLVGARKLHEYVYSKHDMETAAVGVLNFASAKKPGGGFLNGAQAQEESIARVSTLYYSLLSEPAKFFYEHYQRDPDNHMYNHAMVYSPGVVLMRDDRGKWLVPVEVDILTSAAVNAGEHRKQVEKQVKMRDVRARFRVFQENEAKARKAEEAERAARRQKEKEKAKEGEGRTYKERLLKAGSAARAKAKEAFMRERAQNDGADIEMGDATDPESIPLPPSPPGAPIDLEPTQDGAGDNDTSLAQSDSSLGSTSSKRPLSSEIHPEQVQEPSAPEEKPPSLQELLAVAEQEIEEEMTERIARLLYLFYLRGAQHIVLGSFGTGVFQNKIEMVAKIFYDLLAAPTGKFYGVFETVLFAILGADTVKVFQDVFAGVVMQQFAERQAGMAGETGASRSSDEKNAQRVLKSSEDMPMSVDTETETPAPDSDSQPIPDISPDFFIVLNNPGAA